MKLSTWNIRGGNDPRKQQEVLDFLHTTRVDILGVLETRVKEKNSKAILASQFHAYKVLTNYKYHINGRIWLLWKPATVTITPLIIHAQFIHCAVLHHATCQQFHCTVVYASNDAKERIELWSALSAISLTVASWIVLGDFNVVRNSGLDDIQGTDCEFTWTNKQEEGTRMWSKLDRALTNPGWSNQFPATSVNFMPAEVSDHSPVLVTVFKDAYTGSRFSFLNCWTLHPDYHSTVIAAWEAPVQGSNTYKFFSKLKVVKAGLKSLHKQHYSNIAQRVCSAKEKLHQCQLAIQGDPLSVALLDQERSLLDLYIKLKKAEGNILKQKAKLEHISHNDSSTILC
ncbi:uncharacterized protein LOC141649210 [Silene latifolia]|uniref:uncharacterized protein LOC141649210 n=1 Tax=Silene latifolia TaxID=37657 RepID=UPI003D773D45